MIAARTAASSFATPLANEATRLARARSIHGIKARFALASDHQVEFGDHFRVPRPELVRRLACAATFYTSLVPRPGASYDKQALDQANKMGQPINYTVEKLDKGGVYVTVR